MQPIWKHDIPQKRKNLRFAFYLYFLIDIIDNIITYSPYSPYYVTRTSANGSAASLSRDTDKNHVTSVLYRFWFHSIAPLYFSFTVPLICSFGKKYDYMIRCEYHKKTVLYKWFTYITAEYDHNIQYFTINIIWIWFMLGKNIIGTYIK